jgi:hypothetical protein
LWHGNRFLVIPLICGLLGFVTSTVVATTPSGHQSIFSQKKWLVSADILALVVNGSCTGTFTHGNSSSHAASSSFKLNHFSALITYKIWSMYRLTQKHTPLSANSNYRSVVEALLESGVVYFIALVSFVATLVSESWAVYLMMALVCSTFPI